MPGSLDAALNALEEDHDFLTAGDVFTDDLIETWLDLKRGEIDQARLAPTPLGTSCTSTSDLYGPFSLELSHFQF